MFWILVSTVAAFFIYKALIKPFNYWKDRGVAQYPFWDTWKETALGLMRRRAITEGVEKLYKDFPNSRYSGLYQFYRPMLNIRDPELIKQIVVKDFDHFVDHTSFIPDDIEPLFSKNLVSLKGDKWRDMRATLSPSFTSSKMKQMFGLISECAQRFVKYFQDQGLETVSLEMKDAFTRYTNDVIASSAFGFNCDSMNDRDNDFYKMGKEVTNGTGFLRNLRFIVVFLAPKLAKILGIAAFPKDVTNFFTKTVKENIETREREGIVRPDMLHLLMEARKQRSKDESLLDDVPDAGFATVDDPLLGKEVKRKKEQITDEDIVAQALIFFFAGFETVSTLMCFMAHELAVNPDVQEQLQSEIDDTLSSCEGSVTYEALMKMKYLDMVISESLRKWPSAVAMERMCTKPYTIQPTRKGEKPVDVKEASTLFIPTYGIHRDPQFYPEPDRFDPERFSDENKDKIVPYTYLPFGLGPRSCIGNRFALMETKLVFFHILSKFDLVVVEKTTVPIKIDKNQFQLLAEGGFWLGLKKRKTETH